MKAGEKEDFKEDEDFGVKEREVWRKEDERKACLPSEDRHVFIG